VPVFRAGATWSEGGTTEATACCLSRGEAPPIHQAQLLSYLRLSGCKVGLLINFNVKVPKDGIRRVVNDFPDAPRSLRAQR